MVFPSVLAFLCHNRYTIYSCLMTPLDISCESKLNFSEFMNITFEYGRKLLKYEMNFNSDGMITIFGDQIASILIDDSDTDELSPSRLDSNMHIMGLKIS